MPSNPSAASVARKNVAGNVPRASLFGNSPDFWLNVRRRGDLWAATNSPRERERIKRAKPLGAAA